MPEITPLKKSRKSKVALSLQNQNFDSLPCDDAVLVKNTAIVKTERQLQVEANNCGSMHDLDQAILHNVVFPLIVKHYPKILRAVPAVFSPIAEIYADYFAVFWSNLQLIERDSTHNYFKIQLGGEYRSLWHPQIYVLSQEMFSDDLGKYVSKAIRSSLKNIGKREELEQLLDSKFPGVNGKRYLFAALVQDINDYELRAYRTPELEVVDAFLHKHFPMAGQTYNPDTSIYKLMETVKSIAQSMDMIMFGSRKVSIFMEEESALYVKTKLKSAKDNLPTKINLNNLAEFVFLIRSKAGHILKKVNLSEGDTTQRQYGVVVRYINWLVKMMNLEIVSQKTKDALEEELMILFKERDRLQEEMTGVEKLFQFQAKIS